MDNQRTFLIIKPDGLKRGLVGEIIKRIEQKNLKISNIKMLEAGSQILNQHYQDDDNWFLKIGKRTKADFENNNEDVKSALGTENEIEIGKIVKKWLIEYMTSGPIIIMIIEGLDSPQIIRRMTGATMPNEAVLGSIRGDLSADSAELARIERRSVFNLIHSSENSIDAEKEIKLWFG